MGYNELKEKSAEEVVEGVMGKPVKKQAPKSDKEAEEVSFRKVDNGFVATIRYKDKKESNGKDAPCCTYGETATRICSKASDGAALLQECFE